MKRRIGVGLIVAAFVLLSLQRFTPPVHQQATPVIVPPHINTPAESWEQEKGTREMIVRMKAQTDRMYNVQPQPQGIEALKQEREQMRRTQGIQPQQPVQAPVQQPASGSGNDRLAFLFDGMAVFAGAGLLYAIRQEKRKQTGEQGGKKS